MITHARNENKPMDELEKCPQKISCNSRNNQSVALKQISCVKYYYISFWLALPVAQPLIPPLTGNHKFHPVLKL